MRLTEEQRSTIREQVEQCLGAKALVRVFCSWVDDNARGDDINPRIETIEMPSGVSNREMRLRSRLARRLSDRIIGIVVLNTGDTSHPIDVQACRTVIRL